MHMHGLFIAALVALALAAGVHGHAGHLHNYPDLVTLKGYDAVEVGTCSSWEALPAPEAGVARLQAAAGGRRRLRATGSAPAAALESGPMPTVTGNAIVWSYLYRNCSNHKASSVEINITATQGASPADNYTMTGEGRTGTCASGSGTTYWLNTTALGADEDPAEYKIWFHNAATNNTGRLWGNAANPGTVVTTGAGAIKSFVLMDHSGNDIACCDLTLSAPADTNWTADLGVGVGECDDNYLPTNGTAPNSASRAGAGLAAVLAAAVAALVL